MEGEVPSMTASAEVVSGAEEARDAPLLVYAELILPPELVGVGIRTCTILNNI